MNEPVAWKAYEEVNFNDQYTLRWVREGDEYVNRISKEMMEDFKHIVEKPITNALETLENLLDIADNGIKEGYKTMNSHFVIEEVKEAILEIRKAQEK